MIVEYKKIYNEDVKYLLEELQKYIVSLDKEKYNIIGENFKEEYLKETLDEIRKYEGKMFLYKENGKIAGLVVGVINNEEIDTYNFKAPKRGRVTELIVSSHYRNMGIGEKLLDYMEEYLKGVGCKDVLVGVFAYNKDAWEFYKKRGFKNRMIEMTKSV